MLLTDLLLESSQAEAEGAGGFEVPPTATGDDGAPLKEHASWNAGRASMEVGVAPPHPHLSSHPHPHPYLQPSLPSPSLYHRPNQAGVGASLRGALRNSSRLCDAVVHSLQAEDLDTRDKASRALEQIFDAGLELLPSLVHSAVAGGAGAVAGGTAEPSSCLGDAMRAALRDFTAAWTAQCEAAADGCGDDDVLPRLRRLEARVEEQIKNIMKEEL